jgi:hypothetical protein
MMMMDVEQISLAFLRGLNIHIVDLSPDARAVRRCMQFCTSGCPHRMESAWGNPHGLLAGNFSVSSGMILNKSPTNPKSAI